MRLTSRFHGTARWMSCVLTALALATGAAKADNLPMTHPTVDLVKKYFRYVIEQNWREAAKMIRPSSIERKKRETLAIVKSAPTMSEEAAMLGRLGVKDLKELEKMSVEDFYIADRQSFQRPQSANEEVQKQKRESLKVNVLGVVGEQDNKIVHLVVRTSQEVIDQRIDEIFFISFTQDETDSSKWVIAPDIQRPVTEPLKTPAKPAAVAPAPAPEVKAETNPDIKVAPSSSKKK